MVELIHRIHFEKRDSYSPGATFTLECWLFQKQCQTIGLFDFQFIFETVFTDRLLLGLLRGVGVRPQILLTPLWLLWWLRWLCRFFFFFVFERLLTIIHGARWRWILRTIGLRFSVFLLQWRNEAIATARRTKLCWMMELCIGQCDHSDRRAQR